MDRNNQHIDLPSQPKGSLPEQVQQIYSYLVQTANQLNYILSNNGGMKNG